MDTIILLLIIAIGLGLIKVWSKKPVDDDGKIIISVSERVIGLVIMTLVIITTLLVQRSPSEVFDVTALITLIVVGITVFWTQHQNSKKK